jgi:hypothetical protein
MTPRPRILIAIEPPLLADLVRRALDQDDVDIDITDGSQAAAGSWDVVVVTSEGREQVRADHVIDVTEMDGSEFESLVALLRTLCGR